MKTLFLVRHAKAGHNHPTLRDVERPLTEKGFSDARLVSEVLRQQDLIPEKIISSHAVRASATAFAFAATFEKVHAVIDTVESLYDTGVREYLSVIASISDSFASCLLVGHNETITDVAGRLLGKDVDPMQTCEVLVISSEAETWMQFDSGPCSLQLRLYPELLE